MESKDMIKILLAVLTVSSASVFAFCQEPTISSGTMTLKQVLDLAERVNPEILAARKRWEAVSKRLIQAVTPEKPRLDIEKMYTPSGKNILSEAEERSVAISQEIPFPSTLYLRRAFADKEADMAEQAYRAKLREVLARVRSTYSMLYLAQRSLEIFNENIELMRRFSKVAESKYTAGHASQSDALKAQVELTKMLNMNVILIQDKESAQATLNALLSRPARAPLAEAAEPSSTKLTETIENLENSALTDRPELREAKLGTERAGKALALARSEFLPDFMLQYRRRSDPMRGITQDGIVGFSLPLWFWKPAAMVAEAKAEREMYEAELEAMRLATLSDLRSAFVRVQTAQRLAEIYRTSVLPQGEAALKVAEAGYQAEKSSFLDLLDAQRSLLTFRLEYYQYLAESQTRLAELERAVGRRLSP
jgi:outer membrane protein TolC